MASAVNSVEYLRQMAEECDPDYYPFAWAADRIDALEAKVERLTPPRGAKLTTAADNIIRLTAEVERLNEVRYRAEAFALTLLHERDAALAEVERLRKPEWTRREVHAD